MTESLFPKRCKVYPRNGLQFIPGILEKRERIEFPAELPLTEKELRRCMSFADVYEVREDDECVYLDTTNYYKDNSDAEPADDVPDVELLYPRDEKSEDDEDDDGDQEEDDPPGEEESKDEKKPGVGVSPGFDGDFNIQI